MAIAQTLPTVKQIKQDIQNSFKIIYRKPQIFQVLMSTNIPYLCCSSWEYPTFQIDALDEGILHGNTLGEKILLWKSVLFSYFFVLTGHIKSDV